jgi:hypothetical protein
MNISQNTDNVFIYYNVYIGLQESLSLIHLYFATLFIIVKEEREENIHPQKNG